ncbi:hypothetical protein GTO91_01175 [Heliobacterium undosum]|uniref:Uncharacterized protein n=1 Tax=Heliomicrobium undosum TaxID=121734 RepID=A0A845KY56_9FIRM|nr:hypothetical protein [Heliomicrobium undosum]MZP28333.1 hypothetical protein [Heliomicrobium undosum]
MFQRDLRRLRKPPATPISTRTVPAKVHAVTGLSRKIRPRMTAMTGLT